MLQSPRWAEFGTTLAKDDVADLNLVWHRLNGLNIRRKIHVKT